MTADKDTKTEEAVATGGVTTEVVTRATSADLRRTTKALSPRLGKRTRTTTVEDEEVAVTTVAGVTEATEEKEETEVNSAAAAAISEVTEEEAAATAEETTRASPASRRINNQELRTLPKLQQPAHRSECTK